MSISEQELERLEAGVIAGERRAVARALRWVDDVPSAGRLLAARLHRQVGRARIVGVTGNPGAGKSTVVDQMISGFRASNQRVAVLAVDPSSPFSGGAILGDRIRMSRHATDDEVFIRSLATRGALGGLSRAAFDAARVLDAAGFDVVILETVGVGQDEVDVARLAHTTVVVMVPGLGDDVQAIKAGLLEIADVFLINKADRDGVDELERSLRQVLTMAPQETAWEVPVLRSIAARGEGIDALLETVGEHARYLDTPEGRRRTRAQAAEVFDRVLDAALVDAGRKELGKQLREARDAVERGADPHLEVTKLIDSRLLGAV